MDTKKKTMNKFNDILSVRCFVILLFILSTGFHVYAQDHYLLDNFTATKDRARIILTWTMKAGATCFGTGILRSDSNSDFKVIGNIPGICGSEDEKMTFSYIDENPIPNATNYYVLELGFSGQTEPPLKVDYIVFNDKSSKAIPNPMRQHGRIVFENINNTLHTIKIYDSQGRFHKSYSTQDDFFSVEIRTFDGSKSQFLSAGLYFYTIENEKSTPISTGSFILTD